ncbi:MAG TPA: carboxypeptidase-like regulatory domain-containing protein, partial [Bacteroidales bacterium]|nr:carboxypeptidase-like regulatory domain-containing protein [Bacteroidales bacterium]
MRNFSKYLLTMMILLISSSVVLAQLRVTNSGGKSPVLPESRAVLYQQTNSSGAGMASQDFETVYDAYDCQGADDFYVPAGMQWTIQTITATGSGSTTATLVHVYIYADNAGMPAASASTTLMNLTCTNANAVLTINIPGNIVLGPGHYWVSVQDASPYATYGQWYWTRTTSIYNSGACWRNPGNGFGLGATTWTYMANIGYPNNDFMFRLEGTSGPVPTCDYRIDLYDHYGDGWNGGYLDVLVNGAVVLDNITLASGSGPAIYYFTVNSGAPITTIFYAGGWAYECYYYIFNYMGAQVWVSDGYGSYVPPPNILPGQLYGNCPAQGAVEGYVFNYDGLAIAGATLTVENGPTTTSQPNGYYIFEEVNQGSTTIVCTKPGYNPAIAVVPVVAGDTVTQNFILTQPNMVINPLYIEETLNPNEYFTTSLNVLNNGNGPLHWEAEIVYPEVDYVPAPPVEPNGNASVGYGEATGDGVRDLLMCPEGSLFSIPVV